MAVEDEFIHGLKCGQASAYEVLVRQFETPLYRFFLASHGDSQLAGEQSADCFGDLVEALPKMAGGPDQLRAFVFGVARNVLRRQWRRHADRIQTVADEHFDTKCPSPDQILVAAEEQTQAIEAVRSLDAVTRDVFLLRYVEQMSISEIAEATGEPVGTVKSRLHRGRIRLHAILQSASNLP